MTIKKLIVLAFLTFSLTTFGQNGEPFLQKIDQSFHLLGFEESSTLFLRYSYRKTGVQLAQISDYDIVKYSNSTKEASSDQPISKEKSKLFSSVLSSISTHKAHYFFFWNYDRKLKEVEINKIEIGKSGNQISEPSPVLSYGVDKFKDIDLSLIKGPFLSVDKKLMYGIISSSKESRKAIVYKIAENEVQEFEIELPVQAQQFKIVEQQCDAAGNIYMLAYLDTENEDHRAIDRKKMYLYRVDGRSGKVRKMFVNAGGSIKTASIKVTPSGELLVAGLTHGGNVVNQAFLIRYSNMLQLVKKSIGEVGDDTFLATFTTTETSLFKGKQTNTYFYDYKTPVIEENKDGSVSVFVQQFYNYTKETTTTTHNGTSTTTAYYEVPSGISGVRFDSEGTYVGGDRVNNNLKPFTTVLYDYDPRDFLVYNYEGESAVLLQNQEGNDLAETSEDNDSKGEHSQLARVKINEAGKFTSEEVMVFPSQLVNIEVDFKNALLLPNDELAFMVEFQDTDVNPQKAITLTINKGKYDERAMYIID